VEKDGIFLNTKGNESSKRVEEEGVVVQEEYDSSVFPFDPQVQSGWNLAGNIFDMQREEEERKEMEVKERWGHGRVKDEDGVWWGSVEEVG